MKQVFNWKGFAGALKTERFRRQYEEEKRIGLRQLGKEAGVNFTTVSRIENGKRADIESVILLCRWMRANVNEFIKK